MGATCRKGATSKVPAFAQVKAQVAPRHPKSADYLTKKKKIYKNYTQVYARASKVPACQPAGKDRDMGYEQVHSRAAAENLRRAAHDAATRIDYLEGQNQRLRESRDKWRERAQDALRAAEGLETGPNPNQPQKPVSADSVASVVKAWASDEDSREKLEADIALFWGVTYFERYFDAHEMAQECIGWLDRQEEITRKELANG